ncbi:amidohydrolase family protein [Glaciibacter sp. 2TAF33]|uniref:amidohydrolase family protein n=1 Tax=Glaciibacter sp. 2TAF33 TaxID=3233015 RepID=UPI003F90D41B
MSETILPGSTVFPGFIDAHVHLALIDPAPLAAGGIARVLDLGGWAPPPGWQASTGAPDVIYAHQFLAAAGGYPGAQAWAPPGCVQEVRTATDARTAVDAQLAAGASVVKITLNNEAGPVFDSEVLRAIVGRAHEHSMPVVAHAQGVGQALRAYLAGVDALAHTPFSERLVDDLVEAMAGRMTWISTLDIHGWGEYGDDFARASDNLRRFHAHGGQVLYGTDLGNGPLPVGLNRREIDALLAVGLSTDAILGALTAVDLGDYTGALRPRRVAGTTDAPPADTRVTVVPGERPVEPAAFAEWLCTAQAVSRTDLEDRR